MPDEHSQVADRVRAEQRSARGLRHPAVERDNASHIAGHRQPEPVRRGCPFADSDQVDAFGVNVILAASVGHCVQQVFIGTRIVAPREFRPTRRAQAERSRPARTRGDVVPSAQKRRKAGRRVLVAAIGVEQHHERVCVLRLIVGWEEQPHRTIRVGRQEGSVETFRGAVSLAGME